MSNPFKKIADNAKNTKSSQQFFVEKKVSTSYVLICEVCGAPRPKKTNLTKCDYCKSSFMDIDANIRLNSL